MPPTTRPTTRRAMLRAPLVALVLAMPVAAHGQEAALPVPVAAAEPPPLPALIVSVPIMALSSNGLALQAERPLFPHGSAVAALGWRDGADGTYDANTFALGGELRFWLKRQPRGLFAGPRIESAIVHVRRDGEGLGTAVEVTEGLILGYRLVVLDRVELSMLLGYGLRHDLPTKGIPASTRATPLLGFTAGWVFE
jgi:hypothetical protein